MYLGYTAYGLRDGTSGISRAEVTRALEIAKQAGIGVNTELPRQMVAAPFLSLKPYEFDPEVFAQSLLGTVSPAQQQSSRELAVWAHENKRVTWVASGAVLYINEAHSAADKPINATEARKMLEIFLQQHNMLPEDSRLDFVREIEPSRYTVQYCQDFGGTPIYGGYINATVDSGGVDRLRFLWFNPIGLGPKRRTLIPATDCLVNIVPLVAEKFGAGTSLTSLKMGYLSEGIDARQWDAFPVWRFEFSERYYIYVNAYTGEIDRVEEIG